MQLQQLDLHVEPELLVERAERLVEQQDRGPRHQRPGERHALALAAAQLMDAAAVFVAEADQLQGLDRPIAALVLRQAAHLQAVLDVLADRHMGKQGVVLEDRGAVAVRGRHGQHVAAGDPQRLGLARLLQARDDAQQRGLARAALPEDGQELALAGDDRDLVEGDHLVEAMGHAHHLEDRRPADAFRGRSRAAAGNRPGVLAGRRSR